MHYHRILYFFFVAAILSCNKDKKSITVTDFTKVYTDSISPDDKSYSGYTTYYVEIKGEVNDSVIFKFARKEGLPFYFKGVIDEKLSFDYYGGHPCFIKFNPYKASKGKLKISYELL